MTTPRMLGQRYEVGEVLGRGGMAEVHRGRDIRLGREVAIKVLRSDIARDPSFQARFRREAQAAASLNHPAIVAVYDTGEDSVAAGDVPYIVMEYVEGRTLRDVLKDEGVMEVKAAMSFAADICAALDFSHRNGIVHRDVKPGNVMITPAGAVKVMDFGIARAVSDSSVTMTSTAAVIGTAQYLSPEQARGESVDARSDVYSAGCLLFELVTGGPPFTGDSPVAVAYQHVREDPRPPSTINPAVPASLDAVVLKAMSKNPANRYQSAAEMRTDLLRAVAGQRVEATPVMSDNDRTAMIAPATGTRYRPAPAVVPVHDRRQEGEDDEAARRRRRIGFVILAIALLALIGAAVALFLVFNNNEEPTPTPTPTVEVPALAGLSEQDARTAIEAANLEVGEVTQVASDAANEGLVVEQSPAPLDAVQEGTSVDFVVGSGPDVVAIPTGLIGLTEAQAQRLLEGEGFQVVQPSVEADSLAPAGEVIAVTPAEGSEVRPETSVTLTISTGVLAIPDVIGFAVEDAEAALRGAGFNNIQRTNVESEQAAGTVVEVSPAVGTAIAAGDPITLAVAVPVPPTATPTPTPTATTTPTATPLMGTDSTRREKSIIGKRER
ncbi:MAG: Stk1 family PASTA domain-containing Ser/Thr kinase [Geodermatophilaceae bacterium]|nr:Stk1 family PASTA domain-containing Ser/Thr kinase [Geodermatophilaceae bacterium]